MSGFLDTDSSRSCRGGFLYGALDQIGVTPTVTTTMLRSGMDDTFLGVEDMYL